MSLPPKVIPTEGPLYLIDVECVASGPGHLDREVAQIAIMDANCKPVLNLYVKPSVPVVSYLTLLTGITREKLEDHGIPLEDALQKVYDTLPKDAIVCGWNVKSDIAWLKLRMPDHCAASFNVQCLYMSWNHRYGSRNYYGLQHCIGKLLSPDLQRSAVVPSFKPPPPPEEIASLGAHDALYDCYTTLLMLRLFQAAAASGTTANLQRYIDDATMTTPFSTRYPTLEGVCMGNKRLCRCGNPFNFD